MYQWASTLTSSGQNLPFILPLQTDRTPDGFDISFLRLVSGIPSRTAKICCTVEDIAEVRLEAHNWAGPAGIPVVQTSALEHRKRHLSITSSKYDNLFQL
jgi:hypothetical protein